MTGNTALAEINKARQYLAQAKNITDVLKIRDQALAIKVFATARGAADAAAEAAEIQLRCERKAGQFLIEMKAKGELDKGGRPSKTGNKMLPVIQLSDFDIEKMESHRWQKIALIPETKFEEYMVDAKIATQSALLSVAREYGIQEDRIERKKTPIPFGSYNVILADPPWQYDFSETESREIEKKYPTMPVDEIKSLKIPSNDDAILFLWATAPKLREALEVMKAWGFEYKTHAVWNKEKIGMGYWFRGQHELLLVGTKGNISPPIPENRSSSIFNEKREEHSRKPRISYEILEQMTPGMKRIELFARDKRDGWEAWGNEVQ